MSKKEIYISVDVETDGPIPGQNSMLSLGAAAFLPEHPDPIATFSKNLFTLREAAPNPDTMKWWDTQPEAWEECRKDPQLPSTVMTEFYEWVENIAKEHDAKPVCVAYPSGFDFTFVYWYLIRFVRKSPFGFNCVDIKTYAMAMLKKGYYKSNKKGMPKHWFSDAPHTHKAVDDAIEQGLLFMNMLRENTP